MCPPGYLPSKDKKKCEKKECKPSLAPVAGSTMTKTVVLKYLDTHTVTCKKGYDVTVAGKIHTTFTVSCLLTGELTPFSSCVKVKCPLGVNDHIEYAPLTLAQKNKVYSFGDKLTYTCTAGYTTTGGAGGVTTIVKECGSSGTFQPGGGGSSSSLVCHPVSCGNPPTIHHGNRPNAVVKFGGKVTYTCDTGYELDASGKTTFELKCQETGKYTTPVGVSAGVGKDYACQKISCGKPPNVKYAVEPTSPIKYLQSFTYTCKQGYSIGGAPPGQTGGETQWTVQCLASKLFAPMSVTGHAIGAVTECKKYGHQVTGLVINAQTGGPLGGATVTVDGDPASQVTKEDGQFTFTTHGTKATIIAKMGPKGKYKEGFVDGKKILDIPAGGLPADQRPSLYLEPKANRGVWAIALYWDDWYIPTPSQHRDLDSFLFYGKGADKGIPTYLNAGNGYSGPKCMIDYNAKGIQKVCVPGQSPWVKLDVDWGPPPAPPTGVPKPVEHITTQEIDPNTCGDYCRFKFLVHDYSINQGTEPDWQTNSNARVVLTNGGVKVKEFFINKAKKCTSGGSNDGCIGTDGWGKPTWSVFDLVVNKPAGQEVTACKNFKCT